MNKKNPKIKQVINLFENEKCCTINYLSQALEYSNRSTYRLLKKVGYYSSFTHNGKWYTLEDMPEFDDNGLWFYQEIGFSKWRSLITTIHHLIDHSAQGLTARDLSSILSSSCAPVLNKIYKAEKIDRVKTSRGFVYISINSIVNEKQLRNLGRSDVLPNLSDADKITILVEFIRFPEQTCEELSSHIKENSGISYSTGMIKSLFIQLGLEKKILQR